MGEDNFSDIVEDDDMPYHDEKRDYEQEILRQMRRCVDILSKEVRGGIMQERVTKNGTKEVYVEDVRDLIINSVNTLHQLLEPYLTEEYRKQIQDKLKDIQDFKDKINQQKVRVDGKGIVNLAAVKWIDPNSPFWQEYLNYKAETFREIFGLLVLAYHKRKAIIAERSEE